MLDMILLALRIDTEDMDDELNMYISACEYDLARVGIAQISETDPVIQMLVQLYVKAALNFHENGERYKEAYEKMRDGLSLAGDYNGME